ncbi:cobyrinate a,c-diamide synthase [Undibacterium fentianense]|nr:cobyrinate a,c-diamide synthase [Undibacterium fentianense]
MKTQLAPVVMISAIASGQGKTSVTAALARHFRDLGWRVRIFKTGADFIDPMLLETAVGAPVLSLDLWLVGLAACRAMLIAAAQESDLVLIEGVMGLYDGTPSSADLANALEVPVIAVIDASAMAQTAAAIVYGLRDFGPVHMAGLIANRVSSSAHLQLIKSALGDIPIMASLPPQTEVLPERHLGLVIPGEIDQLDQIIQKLADSLQLDCQDWKCLKPLCSERLPYQQIVKPGQLDCRLKGRRIAIARDHAFAFIYPANIQALKDLGADLVFFSPCADQTIPHNVDALYLPGGYPELHAKVLTQASCWLGSLREFAQSSAPIYAECGGMISLVDTLCDLDGMSWPMAGLLPGTVSVQKKLQALGMQTWVTRHGVLRGHTFHYSRFDTTLVSDEYALRQHTEQTGEPIYRLGNIQASYFHAYFPSNLAATARLFLDPNSTENLR